MVVDEQPSAPPEVEDPRPRAVALADQVLRETVLGFAARLSKLSRELQALRGELERDAGVRG